MITVISGTNRHDTECLLFADFYCSALQAVTPEEVKILALDKLSHDWFFPEMYEAQSQSPTIREAQDSYILPAHKFVIISPEYNGSIPGALKLFIDACSVRKYKANFGGKKVALLGISAGRAGNLRGMEHLTGIINHQGGIVFPNKLPVSQTHKLLDEQGRLQDPTTIEVLKTHAEEFARF